MSRINGELRIISSRSEELFFELLFNELVTQRWERGELVHRARKKANSLSLT
jgi:hypothetical protein